MAGRGSIPAGVTERGDSRRILTLGHFSTYKYGPRSKFYDKGSHLSPVENRTRPLILQYQAESVPLEY
jgi:hypothetical protein